MAIRPYDMDVRKLSFADKTQLLNFLNSISDYPNKQQSILPDLSQPHATILAAYEEAKICGIVDFHQVLDEASLIEIIVHPDYRRKGIARLLIQKMNEYSVKKIILEVRASNKPARLCYEALGFKEVQVRPKYYADGEDAVVYIL